MRSRTLAAVLTVFVLTAAGAGWATRERMIYCKSMDRGPNEDDLVQAWYCISQNRWTGRLNVDVWAQYRRDGTLRSVARRFDTEHLPRPESNDDD